MDLTKLSLKQTIEALEKGETTSLELTKAYLDRIEKLDPQINAFLLVTKELALKQAEESDNRRKQGKTFSKLDGIPMALKDVFSTKGVKTTAASKILEDYIPPFNSTVVDKLFNAGCVLLGKTNTDEFTIGDFLSSAEISIFASHLKCPFSISASETPIARIMSRNFLTKSFASWGECKSGSVTISISGVPALFKSTKDSLSFFG